jgi:hypothetical protein
MCNFSRPRRKTTLKALAAALLIVLAAGRSALAEDAERASQERSLGVTLAFFARDARDLCGFKLTAPAERLIADVENETTAEQKAFAEGAARMIHSREPLATFCVIAKGDLVAIQWLAAP